VGYVIWQGTQHNPDVPRTEKGIPKRPAGTLALIGDLKQMSPKFLRGVSIIGYGTSLAVGIGLPIPILSEEILLYTTITDADIIAPVVDYSVTYPQGKPEVLAEVSYKDLKGGYITIDGKEVPTASLSSYPMAQEIARTLKSWIKEGKFLLTEPSAPIPGVGEGVKVNFLNERPIEEEE
jgi:uncharacterized protein (DUF39 family)